MRFVIVLVAFLMGLPAARAAGLPELDGVVGKGLSDAERKAIEDAFLEEQPFLGGNAWVARPSADAHKRMSDVARAHPKSVAAQAYLAHAATAAGDFAAAETAWKETVSLSGGEPWALWALAEHHRARLQPEKALAALEQVADAYRQRKDRQALRGVYQHAIEIVKVHGVGDEKRWRRAQAGLFPEDPGYLRVWLEELSADATVSLAEIRAEIAHFRKAFPRETRLFTRVEANELHALGKTDDAVALWRGVLASASDAEDGFEWQLLWLDFFDLLRRAGRLDAETAALEDKAKAGSLAPIELAELCYLRWRSGADEGVRKLLDDARARWAPANDGETLMRARLHARAGDVTQAVRYYYAAAAAAKSDAAREQATVELGLTLLGGAPRAAVTPLDLSDAFALDRLATGPSIPGGLASLVFQGVPASTGFDVERQVAAWQNGVRAELVLAEAETTWPKSRRVARLSSALLTWYQSYGFHDAVVAGARRHIKAFPDGADAVQAAIAAAHAERARGDKDASDAFWKDALLRAEKRGADEGERVFDAWGRVLLTERRGVEVVKLYWERIDRNPDDPRLYERMLGFLAQVQLYDEELRVYEKALARFGDASWQHRIARWHVRHRGEKSFRDLTEKLMRTFSGTEAEQYLAALVSDDYGRVASDRSRYYEAIYKMALARFPHRLALVRALIAHYDRHPKREGDARALTAKYAPVAPDLMDSLLHRLGQARELDKTLTAVAKPRGRAERLLRADLLVRLSRQEDALPEVVALAADWPDDERLALRAAHLLAAVKPDRPGDAAAHLDRMTRWYPTRTDFADEAGALLAEAGELAEARKRWEHLVAARKGTPQAYVELAAALWDWYLFDDAEQAFARARKKTGDPLLFWDKAGLVQESRRDLARAAAEYVAAHVDEVGRAAIGLVDPEAFSPPEERWDEGEEYHDEAPRPSDPHLGESSPTQRLLELARKKGGDKAILDAYVAAERRAPQDFRPVLARVRWLRSAGRGAEARRELLAAIPRFKDDAFLVSAIGDATVEKWSDAAIAALERRADLGGGTPELVWPLADALEAAGEHARAEARIKAVVAAAKDPVFARVRYSDFLLRRGRIDEAFAERRAAAERASGRRKDEILLDLAWRATDAGRLDEARKLFDDLQARNPRDLRPVDGAAEVLARQGNGAGLREHYQKAIAAVRAVKDASAGEKEALIADLRRAFITRLEQARLHVDAVDQWIEIVNRDAGRRDVVLGAMAYARRHKALDRLVAYYEKTAKASPKDVRWPLVLAWIHEASGKPADAAAAYGRALVIRPERLDLLTAQGDAYVAAGDFAAADRAFERAYRQSDEDVRWLLQRARAQARLGNHKQLRELLGAYVARAAFRPVARYREAAAIYAEVGLDDDAWSMQKKALEEALAQPSTLSYRADDARDLLETGTRAGKVDEASKLLERALAHYEATMVKDRGETWVDDGNRNAVLDALTFGAVELAGVRALDADARALYPVAERHSVKLDPYSATRLADQTAHHGVFESGVRILAAQRDRPKASSWERQSAETQLLYLTLRAGDFRGVLALAEKRTDDPSWIATAVSAARELGDTALEKEWLARYWDRLDRDADGLYAVDGRDPHVIAYLELLRRTKDRKALETVALRGGAGAGQVADWLLAAGEPDLAMKAVEAVRKRLDLEPVWAWSKLAMGFAAAGVHGARTHELFQKALVQGAGLEERAWWALAKSYAHELAASPAPGVRLEDYVFADAEDHPLRPSAQLGATLIYLERKDWERAEAHARQALELAPASHEAWNLLARARLGAGDRDGAMKAWDAIRASGSDADALLHARYLRYAGLVKEAQAQVAALLAARWANLDARTGRPIVDALVEVHEGDTKAVDRVLRGLHAKGKKAWLVEQVIGFSSTSVPVRSEEEWDGDYGYYEDDRQQPTLEPILGVAELEPWIADALASPDVDAQQLREAWTRLLLSADRFALARKVAEEARAAAGKTPPAWIALAIAETELDKDPVPRLAAVLVATGGPLDVSAAVEMFQRRKRPDLAAKLTIAWYEATDAAPGPRVLVELATARLVLGDVAAAVALLETRVTAEPANPGAYREAAVVLEGGKRAAEARKFRERLARLIPHDAENRVALARAALDAGDADAAVDAAAAVLGDRRAPRLHRDTAAAIIRDAAGKGAPAAKKAVAAVAKRAETTPGDAATLLALAHARRAAGDAGGADAALTRALEVGVAPRDAAVALARSWLAAGKAADAAKLLERAMTQGASREARETLFQARRANGHHAAAVLALADPLVVEFRGAGSSDEGKARRAALVARGKEAWAGKLALVTDAADSAERAGAWTAAAWFRAVAGALDEANRKTHETKATAALQQALVVERRAERRYLHLSAEVRE